MRLRDRHVLGRLVEEARVARPVRQQAAGAPAGRRGPTRAPATRAPCPARAAAVFSVGFLIDWVRSRYLARQVNPLQHRVFPLDSTPSRVVSKAPRTPASQSCSARAPGGSPAAVDRGRHLRSRPARRESVAQGLAPLSEGGVDDGPQGVELSAARAAARLEADEGALDLGRRHEAAGPHPPEQAHRGSRLRSAPRARRRPCCPVRATRRWATSSWTRKAARLEALPAAEQAVDQRRGDVVRQVACHPERRRAVVAQGRFERIPDDDLDALAPEKRRARRRPRPRSSSQALTRAPAATRAAVSTPPPRPISRVPRRRRARDSRPAAGTAPASRR